MAGYSLVLVFVLNMLSLSLAYSSQNNELTSRNSISQNGTSSNGSIVGDPPGLRYNTQLRADRPIDTLQAENMFIVVMAELAGRDLDSALQSQRWWTDDYPDIEIAVVVRPDQQMMKVRYAIWGLYHMLGILVQARGNDFVAAGQNHKLGDTELGFLFIAPAPPRDQHGNSGGISANGTVSLPDSSVPVSRRDDATFPNEAPSGLPAFKLPTFNDDDNEGDNPALIVTPRYTSYTDMGEQNVYQMYANAICGLIEQDPFQPNAQFSIRNPYYRIHFFITPPTPRRRRRPFNSRIDSIRVIGRMAAFMASQRRWSEIEADAIISAVAISQTKLIRI